ncbi:hypothetical protein Mro03_61440 [Microbispora rosea subsp. rosea]|nr:hypothetical protein Mro03_61440 [Microbispora rosea subsp. rosea]
MSMGSAADGWVDVWVEFGPQGWRYHWWIGGGITHGRNPLGVGVCAGLDVEYQPRGPVVHARKR